MTDNKPLMMFQTIIESLLEEKIGLSSEAIGSETITKAIHCRMRRWNLLGKSDDGFLAYLLRLRTSREEWESFIDELVVPETWFFRNKASFSFLGGYVRFEWLPQHKERVLRVLSIPCSTGEEPYSIAMALMDVGLSDEIAKGRFHVDAVDISNGSLNKARLGTYGQESFRGEELSFRERYFEQTSENNGRTSKDCFKVKSSVRNMIRFMKGNLIDTHLLADEKPYDIVFCRNLMIYLSDSAKQQAMEVIDRLLAQDGILFVGHVERPLVCSSAPKIRFVWIRQAGVFACRKAGLNEKACHFEDARKSSAARTSLGIPRLSRNLEAIKPLGARGAGQRQPSVTSSDVLPTLLKPLPLLSGAASSVLFPNRGPSVAFSHRISPTSFSGPDSLSSYQESGLGKLINTAQKLADQGELNEALKLCEKYLNEDPFNVHTHFLMGLIWTALGDEDQAEQYFNKTVYLNPNHFEALSHLALIMEHRGCQDKAVHLRHRAQRILDKENKHSS